MKYFVIYEFNQTLESRKFDSYEEVEQFLKDPEEEICQQGDFVKYYIIGGEFIVDSGFLDRT